MVSVSISFWWNEPEPPTSVKLLFEFIYGHRARLYQISSLDINLCMDFNDNSNNRWPVILNLLVFFISATIPRKFRIDRLVLVIQLLLGFFCFNDGLKSSPTCTWRNCHMISTSLSSPAIDFYGNVFSAVFISRKFDITSDGLASVFIQQFVRKIIKNCSSFRSKGR